MAGLDVPWTEILNFLLTSHVEIIVNKICFWKSRDHRTSNTARSKKSYSNGHLPYHYSFYYLARALVYDVAYEFACAVTMRRNNWRGRPQFSSRPKWDYDVGHLPLFHVHCFVFNRYHSACSVR